MKKIKQLEKKLKTKFKSIDKLQKALIHRSYLNEYKNIKLESNERYEFLGDAVLELWASKKLFDLFPDYPEGKLTNLRALVVCTNNLADIAKKLKIGDYLFLSNGEQKNNGQSNKSILADSLEAIIGAIYLDKGSKAVEKFLDKFLLPTIKTFAQRKVYKDPKSLFQELAQEKKNITPHYKTLKETGPDHQKIFNVAVYLNKKLIAKGKGRSKQLAQEAASRAAIEKI
ncbi:ribonuclease III [Patescibacteria group bacterium]|nr:ribonuclease III [Patescibacteria group bacterium]MCG2701616.1 ribonuclease III [Candidatus Parcubacteria bacterium]MBU4264941.1 ribonuclease III [Patescibacteria group bacterium]MBU4389778.1 ribonuclease III [Patescibacteria group bacterium]MBU4396554.1 ribonuclease III [Patescibacteria group bacterium]